MEDREIIDLFFARSERAIVELSYKYGGVCRKVSFQILNNLEDVEECVNDAYLGVWNSIPPSRPDPLIAYVCRITKNVSLNKLRHRQALKRSHFAEIPLSEIESLEGGIPAAENVEEQWSQEELNQSIDCFLRKLDQKSRVMFVKRYWFSQSTQSIAQEFGMRENSVTVKLFRIREKLRKHLEKEGVRL